jgi:cytochrome c peroxidase
MTRRRLGAWTTGAGAGLVAVLLAVLGGEAADSPPPPPGRGLPRGFPPVVAPDENPLTPAKAVLGERLFFDPSLSSDGKISCASCHLPEHAFADKLPLSVGIDGQSGLRNSPSILNAAYSPRLLWDGASLGLEDQVRYPVTHPREMNMTNSRLVKAVEADPAYRPLLVAAFGDEKITYERISHAIASFERTLVAGDSAFDRFLVAGDEAALSASARRGWELFQGKAGCVQCHRFTPESPFFTDFEFYNLGVGWNAEKPDLGRYDVTKDKADRGRFRTPSLRDVARTAPYMHDGSLATLAEVVAFFERGGIPNSYLDSRIKPFQLSPEERADLIAFLESLSSSYQFRRAAELPPAPASPKGR